MAVGPDKFHVVFYVNTTQFPHVLQIPPQCVANVDATVQRVEAEARTTPPVIRPTCAENQSHAWRTSVDRTLDLILKRVNSVEDSMGTVAGSISNIMGELEVVGHLLREEVGRIPPAGASHMQVPHTNAATSYPSGWQQGLSQSNAGDMAGAILTHNSPGKESPPSAVQPPGTEATRPIVLDLENISDESGDNNDENDLRNRTAESLIAKRVHSQPRQRVVPCAKTQLCVGGKAQNGETSAQEPPSRTARTIRYKDPPGYSNARDFGSGEEDTCKPPLLQPKTHGVSFPPPRPFYSATCP
jgi:hypothetical protein